MPASERGFSIVEMVIAMAVMLAATAGVFTLMMPAHGTLAAQPELADMQQRMRVAVDALQRDVLAATAPIRPYRAGPVRPDPPGTFRSDTITVSSGTYWQQDDAAAGTYQLMFYDGSPAGADVPVVDHVVALLFEYYGATAGDDPSLVRLTAADLAGDADLLRIRRIAVMLRVEAAAAALRGPASALFVHGGTSRGGHGWVRDIEVHFDLSPRNLNLGR